MHSPPPPLAVVPCFLSSLPFPPLHHLFSHGPTIPIFRLLSYFPFLSLHPFPAFSRLVSSTLWSDFISFFYSLTVRKAPTHSRLVSPSPFSSFFPDPSLPPPLHPTNVPILSYSLYLLFSLFLNSLTNLPAAIIYLFPTPMHDR